MSGKISTGFAFVVIVLIGGFLGVAIWKIGQQPMVEDSHQATPVSQKPPVANVAPVSDKLVYENKEYGFSLDFPKSWENQYRVITKKNNDSVYFLVERSDSRIAGGYESAFVIAGKPLIPYENLVKKCSTDRMKLVLNADKTITISKSGKPIDMTKAEKKEIEMGKSIGISDEEYDLIFPCSHEADPEMFLGKNTQYAFVYMPPQDYSSEAFIQSEGGWELFLSKMETIAKTFKWLIII